MKNRSTLAKWLKLLAFFIGTAFLIFIGDIILTSVIKKQIARALHELSPNIHSNYSSIRPKLFTSSVSVENLRIYFTPYSGSHQHSFYFPQATITGINFFKIILNKKLFINDLSLEKAEIKLDQFLIDNKDSAQAAILDHLNIPFKNITVNNLKLSQTAVWLHSDTTDQLLLKGNILMQGEEIIVSNNPATKDSFHLADIECALSNINYPIPGAAHTIQIKNLLMDSKQELLQIDSLKIISQNGNIRYDKQSDQRIQLAAGIERLKITKFNLLEILRGPPQNKYPASENSYASSISANDLSMNVLLHSKTKQQQYNFYFPYVSLTGVNFSRIIFNNSFFADSLSLEQGEIKLDPVVLNTNVISPTEVLARQNVHFFNALINTIRLSRAKVWLHSDKVNHMLVTGDVVINKAELLSPNKSGSNQFRLEAITCNFSDINYPLPDDLYTVQINRFVIDSRKEIMRMNSLKLIPRYGKLEFGRRLGRQADRVNATIAEIEILKLDVLQLIHKKLIADKVILDNCNVHVFRDRNLPRQLKQQPMLNDYLERFPLGVRINTFRINNASVVSEEYPKGGTQPGFLKIEKINLSMSPVFNHLNNKGPGYSDTYVEGSIMNSGTIHATIRAPLKENVYSVKGTIKNLDLSTLNPSAESLGKFHVESGVLNNLDFHFTATEVKATGEIVGEYHNLIIEKLKVKNGIKKTAKVPTFFLKHLIIPKNKDKSMNVARRTGKIDYKRDPTRVVTFYLLKSLLSGIRASFGLGFLLPK